MQAINSEIEKQLNTYKEKGFDESQLNELKLGLEAGLDVSRYAKKEFLAIQMREVRIGLAENLPVFIYNHPKYDWFQMEEIREGLEHGVDATVYAKSSLPYEKMRQIRKGLEEGFRLENYEEYSAGILREIRHAHRDQVDITPYIQAGYDAEQLAEIREALKRKCNVDPYIDIWYRGASIKEVWLGLEMGLDVSIYAKPYFNWEQMKQIRIGLSHRLDVSLYAKQLASWKQMREIRLGLEEKLDVSSYASLMFSHTDMSRKRLALREEAKNFVPQEAIAVEKEIMDIQASFDKEASLPKEVSEDNAQKVSGEDKAKVLAGQKQIKPEELETYISVSFSDDDLAAYVEFPKGSAPKTTAAVWISALKNRGVIMGIDVSAIARFQNGDFPQEKVCVARGEDPIPGDDGYYECLYGNDISFKPVLDEDGSVDYSKSTWYKTVRAEDILIIYHPSTVGKNGWTVKGKIAAGKHGKELPALYGNGFRLLKDQVTYVADISGAYDFDGKKLMVTPFLELKELTSSMGNVVFDGSIHILGDVGDNVIIKADGDVIIDGFVENASIEASGDIVVKKGANGKSSGSIKAGKSIKGMFFENMTISAGEDINANYCLNCNMTAENNITIAGKKGVISAGTASAKHLIEAEMVGNKVGSRTIIQLGLSDYSNALERSMEKQIVNINDQLGILRKAFDDMVKKYAVEERNASPIFMKVEDAIYTKEKELTTVSKKLEVVREENQKISKARLKVSGTIYEGTVVQINGISAKMNTTKRAVVRNEDGRIGIMEY